MRTGGSVVYLVDTVQLATGDVDAYVGLVTRIQVPVMTGAGATFVSCWATSRELGTDVDVQTTWSVADHVRWNEIRRNLVLEPDWHRFAAVAASLRRGGTRRFYYPAGA